MPNSLLSPKLTQQSLDNLVSERRVDGIVVETQDSNGRVRLYAAGSSGRPGVALNGDSIFEIGSITKTFTALLCANLVVSGKATLQDPVASFLPLDVKVPGPITFFDLATHTSGLPFVPTNLSKRPLKDGMTKEVLEAWRDYKAADFHRFLATYRLPREVGSKFEYSNVGFALLGEAMAWQAGSSWNAAVENQIFDPLGLSDTRGALTASMHRRLVQGHDITGRPVPIWEVPAMPGFGSLKSSANDLMKYAIANLNPPETALGQALNLTHQPLRPAFGTVRIGIGWDIGMKSNRTVIWHGGSTLGCNSFVGFDPKARTAVVIVANTNAGGLNDLGLHLLNPSLPFDEEPSVVMALYKKALKRGFHHLPALVKGAKYRLPEVGLNNLGYRLLGQERRKEALEVFRLCVQLFPKSSNAFESLGEAYEALGERRQAIRNYRKSLRLDPKNRDALARMKA